MQINLSEIAGQKDQPVEVAVAFAELDKERIPQEAYGLKRIEDFVLTCCLLEGDELAVQGRTTATVVMPCGRCLSDVERELSLAIDLIFSVADEAVLDDEDDPLAALTDGILDVETLLGAEILTELPSKVLCDPECKGLCPKCGQNLNEGECGCDRFVPDPRMQKFLDVFKEV
ncbi:MAG: DUF177 domain-containing protein [Lachnospiraceae bacterium]|nr:DUF177 domain-containing protein [Lachnospiraceae bacterium]